MPTATTTSFRKCVSQASWFFIALVVMLFISRISGECVFAEDDYRLAWQYDERTDRVIFDLTHTFRNARDPHVWSGVAFGTYMVDMDVILVTADRLSGKVVVSDRTSQFYGSPPLDLHQDLRTSISRLAEDTLSVRFSRPMNTNDWQDKALTGCPWIVFPTSGGSIEKNGILGKHYRTPTRRQFCNIHTACTRQRFAQAQRAEVPTTPAAQQPASEPSKQSAAAAAATFKAIKTPSSNNNGALEPLPIANAITFKPHAKLATSLVGESNNNDSNKKLDTAKTVPTSSSRCAAEANRPWCTVYVDKLVDWWSKNKRHLFEMCVMLRPVASMCCEQVVQRRCPS